MLKEIGREIFSEITDAVDPLSNQSLTGGIFSVLSLWVCMNLESIKLSEEPESIRVGNSKSEFVNGCKIERDFIRDFKERAAALRVTSRKARSWLTQLQSRAEESELRTIFPDPTWTRKNQLLKSCLLYLFFPNCFSFCHNLPTCGYLCNKNKVLCPSDTSIWHPKASHLSLAYPAKFSEG